jgi:hypothetical protein
LTGIGGDRLYAIFGHYAERMKNELADRIAESLHAALDRQVGAEIFVGHAERGLAAGGPEFPVIALTVEEVARIAARVARESRAAENPPS